MNKKMQTMILLVMRIDMAEEAEFQTIRINILASENVKEKPFRNLLDSILGEIKIFSGFQVTTDGTSTENMAIENCNYVFYLIADSDIEDPTVLEKIRTIGSKLSHPRQHLFVIHDTANELILDDDDELAFSDSKMRKLSSAFEKNLALKPDEIFHYLTISIRDANVWIYVLENGSISELSDRQVDNLAQDIVTKASKLSPADKRRELKKVLKTIDKQRKLMSTGYVAFETEFTQYFRMLHQKQTVVQNAIYQVELINYPELFSGLGLLKQIFDIGYLKEDAKTNLLTSIDKILHQKAVNHKIATTASVKPGRRPEIIDLTTANERLMNNQAIFDIVSPHLPLLGAELEREIKTLGKLVRDQRCREVENVTDLTEVGKYLASLRSGREEFIEQIPHKTKIIQENLQNTDQWIKLIDDSLTMGVEKVHLIKLVKEVIIAKISHYVESSSNRADLTMTYPQCLSVFLLSHLDKDFVFKNLQMILTYGIRFSGRNLSDLIRNMTEQDYMTILRLEHKLLELIE
jgi:hypothetical protein